MNTIANKIGEIAYKYFSYTHSRMFQKLHQILIDSSLTFSSYTEQCDYIKRCIHEMILIRVKKAMLHLQIDKIRTIQQNLIITLRKRDEEDEYDEYDEERAREDEEEREREERFEMEHGQSRDEYEADGNQSKYRMRYGEWRYQTEERRGSCYNGYDSDSMEAWYR